MLFFLYIFLIFLSVFVFKNNKKLKYFVCIFMLLLSFMATDAPDYLNYESIYNYIAAGHFYTDAGIGWYYLCLVFSKIGVSFRIFKTLMVFLSFVLLSVSLNKNVKSNKKNNFWMLYLIFPLLLDCIQFRFLLAVSILLFSYQFWNSSKFKDVLLSILFILIASSIHSTCYFFLLIYIFLRLISKNTKFSNIFVIYFSIILSTIIFINKSFIVPFLGLFVNQARVERYLLSGTGAGLLNIFINFILMLISYKIVSYIAYKKPNNEVNFVKKINVLSFLLLPLMIYDANFIRLFRVIWILDIFVYLNNNQDNKYIHLFKFKLNYTNLMLILAVVMSLLYFILVSLDSFIKLMF